MAYVRFYHPDVTDEQLIQCFVNSINLKGKWFDVNQIYARPAPTTEQFALENFLDRKDLEQLKPNQSDKVSPKKQEVVNLESSGEPYIVITIQCIEDFRQQQADFLHYVLQHVSEHIRLLLVCCPEDPLVTLSRISNARTEELETMHNDFVHDWLNWYKPRFPHSIEYIFLPELLQLEHSRWNSTFIHLKNENERIFYCVQWTLSKLPLSVINNLIGWYTTHWFHILPCLTEAQQHILVKNGCCYFDYSIPQTNCNERKQFVAGFIC